jgi:hypothetical protein
MDVYGNFGAIDSLTVLLNLKSCVFCSVRSLCSEKSAGVMEFRNLIDWMGLAARRFELMSGVSD